MIHANKKTQFAFSRKSKSLVLPVCIIHQMFLIKEKWKIRPFTIKIDTKRFIDSFTFQVWLPLQL